MAEHAHHGHEGHHHPAPPAGFDGAFAIGAGVNLAFVVAEATFGVLANSVALLADAAHNLGDVLGLLLAWGASWLGRRGPSATRTYGFGRSSILAALINAAVLLVGTGGILVEAGQRLIAGADAAPVAGATVAIVSAIGILVNGGTALLFLRGRHGDLNVRGAFLHMAADAGVSAGVLVSGLLVALVGWHWIDPAVSIGVAALILWSSWGLLRDSVDLAMDVVPRGVDPVAVRAWLATLPGVTEVHDLHIWALSTTQTALTAHLVRPEAGPDDALLAQACAGLGHRFGIGHATLQVEHGDPAHPCALAPEGVV